VDDDKLKSGGIVMGNR